MAGEETLFHPIPQQRQTPTPAHGSAPAMRVELDPDEERESLFETLSFALRAALRRRKLSIAMVAVGLGLTLVAERLAPRAYEVEARVLVLRSGLAAAIVNNNNPLAPDEKRDAKEFEEQIRSRANLESIVKDCKLVERWDLNLTPLRRIVERVGPLVGRPVPTAEMKFNTLAAVLERQLKVNIDTSTVVISVDWPDALLAHDIVQAATKSFTTTRYATEVGVIPEAITILERYADDARSEMERASLTLRDLRHPVAVEIPPPVHESTHTVVSSHADPATSARLAEVQAQIRALTEERRKRLAELNEQLTQMSATYAPGHPEVKALRATIESASEEPPALQQLKAEEAGLFSKTGEGGGHRASVHSSRGEPAPAVVTSDAPTPEQAGEVQDRFESALRRFESLRNRIDEAKIEERTADANFNHRYQVVHPADLPTKPKSPVTLLVGVGGALLTVLFTLFCAALADLLSGVFYEPRRVRDRLKLPVLGEAVAKSR
jgi:uncharacterized protein involved in exopolysaccharide biosynthesis